MSSYPKSSAAFAVSLFLLGSALVIAQACATEETVLFGDPGRVVTSGGPTATTGGTCDPDPNCAVSFQADIFGPIFEDLAQCASGPCHAAEVAGFQYTPGDAGSAYTAILAYQLEDEGPYVAPCDPEGSTILCNLRVEDGSDNPFGSCGARMPRAVGDTVDDLPLTPEQVDLIADWIACGAPEN